MFGPIAFDALCSDLIGYPIADAVAASAAVPVRVRADRDRELPEPLPDTAAGLDRARARQSATRSRCCTPSPKAIARYHNGSMRYVKLLDGGLVDNFGLSGFTIALLSATRPMSRSRRRRPCSSGGSCS